MVVRGIHAKDEFVVIIVIGLMTFFLIPLRDWLILPNILMVYLLIVFLVALKLGRRPSIVAALLSVLVFAYYFVPPHSSLLIVDPQYLLTLVFMLSIALITTHLTSGLLTQIEIAEFRERRIRSLYELASDLAGIATPGQIIVPCCRFLSANFNADGVLLLPDEYGKLYMVSQESRALDMELGQAIFDRKAAFLKETSMLWNEGSLYVLLRGSADNRGVLVMIFGDPGGELSPGQESLLKTFTTVIGLALERLEYATKSRLVSLEMESERLRNALLASLSHDMRTPVAALAGIADAMCLSSPSLSATHQAMLDAMRGKIRMILSDIDKLLDMARLHGRRDVLRKEWQLLEEVIGSAINASASVLEGYEMNVQIEDDMPLLEMDALLMERVFSNLLENAARHTPVGSRIDIEAHVQEKGVVIGVTDNGPGLQPGQEDAVFEKFIHGKSNAGSGGVGLGLAIVRAVVISHGGTIHAINLPEGGVRFEIILPLGIPPPVLI